MSLIRGVDVHPTYQNVTSWAKVYKAGIRFSIQKASENKQYPNAYFKGARAAGLLVGAYHWLHPNKSISGQVEMFADWLRDVGWRSGRDLPPVLDLEDDDGLADATVRARAHTFLDQLDRKLGLTDPWRKTIVYMNPDWRRRMVDVHEGRVLWLAQWPAAFRNEWPTEDGQKPRGAGIWQFVGGEQTRMRVEGIASPCDLNVALLEDLKRMAPDFYGIEEDMDLTAKNLSDIAAAVWNFRYNPGETADKLGGYSPDATFKMADLVVGGDVGSREDRVRWQQLPGVLRAALVSEGMSEEEAERVAHAVVRELVGEVTASEAPSAPRQEEQ